MKSLRCSLILGILMMGLALFGQENSNSNAMIAKIDSIAKAENIETGKVWILYLSSILEEVDTRKKSLTKKSKFHFEGPFLVLDDKYFNMNKLLYFYVDNGVLFFYFQGY